MALIAWLKSKLQTGNLLSSDILAEVTLHLMSDGTFKAVTSKYDVADTRTSQRLVEGLIFTSMNLAKEKGIGINWEALNQQYPYRPPTPPR